MNSIDNKDSFDISSFPVDKIILSPEEQNIFNTIFQSELTSYKENVKTQEIKQEKKKTFIRKLINSILLTSVILIHAITPLSSLLKSLTSNIFGLFVIVAYIVLCYFALSYIE